MDQSSRRQRRRLADLVRSGDVVGRLYIARTGVMWHGKSAAEVICLHCLRRTRVRIEHLLSHATRSCGCLHRQQLLAWQRRRDDAASRARREA